MQTIDVTQLESLGAATVIDVRERDEFAGGRVPGSTNIPLSELVERADEVPEGETVYLVCAAGVRSERAGTYLEQYGKTVVNVDGGFNGWAASGFPVEHA